MIGQVVKINGKTIRVKVDYYKYYSKYDKQLKREKEYLVHNENFNLAIGMIVDFNLCAPVSKMKKHAIVKILKGELK